ncbi:hypothetical protein PUN28_005793 [Cardiocondyla obscurior]|uniref:Uncharacterized protein n=1 Tax=Cardiocondyla obscurior TaxID=286306 RepID=A0AAW2G991_9HYME
MQPRCTLSVSSSLFIGARGKLCVWRGEGTGRAAYGPSDVHADAKATRESDGVLFTRSVAKTPLVDRESTCTSDRLRNVYSLESTVYSRLRARRALQRRAKKETPRM